MNNSFNLRQTIFPDLFLAEKKNQKNQSFRIMRKALQPCKKLKDFRRCHCNQFRSRVYKI